MELYPLLKYIFVLGKIKCSKFFEAKSPIILTGFLNSKLEISTFFIYLIQQQNPPSSSTSLTLDFITIISFIPSLKIPFQLFILLPTDSILLQ